MLVALASVAFLLGRYLRVFEACRVLYRTRQPVQDSLACQAYSALGFFAVLALLAALASAGVALVRRNRFPRNAVTRSEFRRPRRNGASEPALLT